MLVVHTPQSLLHAPKYEILSGSLQPYFEAPQRYNLILNALTRANFPQLSQEWSQEQLEGDERFMQFVREVHGVEYLEFLGTVYERWVGEGGNPVSGEMGEACGAGQGRS